MKSAPFLIALALTTGCAPRAPDIAVSDAWARATAPGQSSGAVYATIANARRLPIALVGVSSEAGMAMLHANEMKDGIARMRMLSRSRSPSGQTVALAPGGTHVMLSGLAAPLAAGQQSQLTLPLRRSGSTHGRPSRSSRRAPLMLGKIAASSCGARSLVAAAGFAFLLPARRRRCPSRASTELPLASIGGPFTLVGARRQAVLQRQARRASRSRSSSASPIAPTSARRPWRGWPSCAAQLGKGDDALRRSSSSASIRNATGRPKSALMPSCSTRR